MLYLGLLAGLLFFLLEPFIHVLILRESTWLTELLDPDIHQMFIRTFVLFFLVAFGYYAHLTLKQRKQAEDELFSEKEHLRVTLLSIGDAVIATDRQGQITLINKVAEQLTGWAQEEATGKPLDEVLHLIDEQTREVCANPVERILQSGLAGGQGKYTTLIARNRSERIIAEIGAPIRDKQGDIMGVALVFRDITEQRVIEEEIRYIVYHDKLTGLYNRGYLEEEIRRLNSHNYFPLSMIMGDVNGLKLVNDAFGHQIGDELLVEITKILEANCRRQDIVARWGGDEFVIVLPRTAHRAALDTCEQIRRACQEATYEPIKLSIALGVATQESTEQNIEHVLKEAEDRMYRNKLVESKSARSSIIASLQQTLGEKTYETEEHALRLKSLALAMGHALGFSDSQSNELALLAVLHDIGKIAIPDSILVKAGPLTADEWGKMKKHPEIGHRIVQASYELAHIAGAILAHHERWDGCGYPQGLKGNDIPLIARVIAIVDAYDVITHERPYKRASSQPGALVELEKCAGSQFDPDLITMFIRMVSSLEVQAETAVTLEGA